MPIRRSLAKVAGGLFWAESSKLAILVTFFKISTSISGFFKVSVAQSLVTLAKINIVP